MAMQKIMGCDFGKGESTTAVVLQAHNGSVLAMYDINDPQLTNRLRGVTVTCNATEGPNYGPNYGRDAFESIRDRLAAQFDRDFFRGIRAVRSQTLKVGRSVGKSTSLASQAREFADGLAPLSALMSRYSAHHPTRQGKGHSIKKSCNMALKAKLDRACIGVLTNRDF